MPRFYASIEGNRGVATRQGTPNSGITGHIRGRDLGITVRGYVADDGSDTFDIFVTSESNNTIRSKFVITVTAADLD